MIICVKCPVHVFQCSAMYYFKEGIYHVMTFCIVHNIMVSRLSDENIGSVNMTYVHIFIKS